MSTEVDVDVFRVVLHIGSGLQGLTVMLQNNAKLTKTKTTGSKQKILSKRTPLLISTVVMFQAQNRETINST